jgi:hypothetical protein
MSSKTWIVVIVVLLFLVILGTLIGMSFSTSHALDKDLDYKTNTAFPPLSSLVSKLNTMYKPYDNSQVPLTVPLTWDTEEGAYMISISIGDSWIELVFDSGSSHISAKGLNCQWKQCDGDTCTTKSCPKTSSFVPRGPQVSLDRKNSTLLEYGSQKSEVTHHVELFSLMDLHPNCADFIRAGNFKSVQDFLKPLYSNSIPMVEFGPTLLYNVFSIEGSTTSNIFGIAQDNEGKNQSVLDSFFPKDAVHSRVWSLACKPSHGLFSLGALRCYGTPKFVPLLVPYAFRKFLTLFYTVKLRNINVIKGGKRIRVKSPPRFVVLDTGTTFTYCNKSLGANLLKAGFEKGVTGVELVIGSSLNSLTMTYPANQLQNAFLTELDELDDMFNNTPILLLGIEQMFNFYFEYNLSEQMLGICAIP